MLPPPPSLPPSLPLCPFVPFFHRNPFLSRRFPSVEGNSRANPLSSQPFAAAMRVQAPSRSARIDRAPLAAQIGTVASIARAVTVVV
jgi:hypothetical protein